jgi:uncharacterized protein (TIGR02466 family)
MELVNAFSVGILRSNHSELLDKAKKLFDGRIKLSLSYPGNILTSLENYNSETKNVKTLQHIPEVLDIIDIIEKNAKSYLDQTGNNSDLYDIKVVNFWINEMESNSESPEHYHFGHTLSGCYYVDVPVNAPGLKLVNPLDHIPKETIEYRSLTAYNARDMILDVKNGDLVLWESYLKHAVQAKEFEGTRCSIAFDINISIKPNKIS